MPYDTMLERADLSLDERLDYYADDIESAGNALDDIRMPLADRDLDSHIRMVILALASIAHSLELEADQIRNRRK